eukprot:69443-Lingulodinium_polyedra.AAC.1
MPRKSSTTHSVAEAKNSSSITRTVATASQTMSRPRATRSSELRAKWMRLFLKMPLLRSARPRHALFTAPSSLKKSTSWNRPAQ